MTEENIFNTENQNEGSPPEDNSFGANHQPAENREKAELSGVQNSVPSHLKQNFDPVAFAEKSAIKRDANIIGASFLIMTGIIYFLNFLIVIVSVVVQSFNAKASGILWQPAVLQVQQILFATVSFTIPFIAVFKLANIRISDLIAFSAPKKQTVLPFFLFGIAFCSFANIASSIAESIFKSVNINYEVTAQENPEGIFGFILSLLATVAVPALAEEFACRGLMLGLLRKFGDGFAIIASALLFGLMHGNFEQMPFAFLVGLVLGFITVKSGTIWIAVAVHAFNNMVSIVFDYFLCDVSNLIKNVGYTIFLIVCLLLGIVAVFLFRGKENDLYKFTPSGMKTGEKQRLIWFFTSVPIIIYIVICILESLQFFV